MRTLLAVAALALLLPLLPAAAQEAEAPARPPSLSAQEKTEKAVLRAKERAAVDAARSEAGLTEAQKKARIKRIHQDYRAQRRALEAGYDKRRGDRRAK